MKKNGLFVKVLHGLNFSGTKITLIV